jgi:hypothetical protein
VISTGEFTSSLAQADPFRKANIRLWDPFVRPANTQQWSFIIPIPRRFDGARRVYRPEGASPHCSDALLSAAPAARRHH